MRLSVKHKRMLLEMRKALWDEELTEEDDPEVIEEAYDEYLEEMMDQSDFLGEDYDPDAADEDFI